MKLSDTLEILQDIFEYLPVQDFLDAYPHHSERKVYETRDELLEMLTQQAGNNEEGEHGTFSLFVDGASQQQNKKAGIGGVIYLDDSEIENFSEFIGEGTNNEAEYKAMIKGLELLNKFQPEKIYVFADSELVVRQINGQYKVKNSRMQKLYGEVMRLLQQFDHWNVEHVPREQNTRADQLSKQAVMAGKRSS